MNDMRKIRIAELITGYAIYEMVNGEWQDLDGGWFDYWTDALLFLFLHPNYRVIEYDLSWKPNIFTRIFGWAKNAKQEPYCPPEYYR